MYKSDEQYMRQALTLANEAMRMQEVPIGAIVVDADGKIIARAHNKVEALCTQTAHAELLALAQAGAVLGNWRLTSCVMYVTLEPCSMCMRAISMHRMAGVVYGADSPLFGFQLDKQEADWVYKGVMVPTTAGVCSQQSASLLQQFFKLKREEHGSRKRIK